MATIRSTSLSDAMQQLLAKVDLSAREYQELADGYAQDAREIIYDRTKAGRGVSEMGGTAVSLRPLAPATVARRERIKMHASTSPRTSNLTETGQMLEDMQAKKRGGFHLIGFRTSRSAKVAGFAHEGGRPFLFLAAAELKVLADKFRRRFAELVKRRLR